MTQEVEAAHAEFADLSNRLLNLDTSNLYVVVSCTSGIELCETCPYMIVSSELLTDPISEGFSTTRLSLATE